MFYTNKANENHDKTEILLDWIKQMEDELSETLHNIETDQSVPNEVYDYLEERVAEMFSKLNSMRDEIIFS